MKIISKFKDYYDYLQGKFGIDEKKVLDRTKFYNYGDFADSAEYITLNFCGKLYYRTTKKIVLKTSKYTNFQSYDFQNHKDREPFLKYYKHNSNVKMVVLYTCEKYTWYTYNETDYEAISEKLPYVVYSTSWNANGMPILKEIGFNNVIPPEEAYKLIEETISIKEQEIKRDPTDMNLYHSKGFDKNSFRNIK